MARAKITMIVMLFLGVSLHFIKDGESRENYNAVAACIAMVIQLVLFYYAGIFTF